MKKLLRFIFINLCIIKSLCIFSQDVQFSQIFSDRIYLNPSYTGIDYCPRILISYRNQWPGVQFPYVTYNAAFDKYVEAIHGGIGIRIMQDKQGGGVFNQLSADFIYAYVVNFSSNLSLRLALEVSIYQKSLNTSNLVFSNMINPSQGVIYPNTENIANQNILTPDFSTGFLLRYKNYFAGFSASHLPQNIVIDHNELLPLKFTAHVGSLIQIDKNGTKQNKYILEPNIVFIKQQNLNMLYYGTYFDIDNLSLGLFLRQNLEFHFDALVASFHIKLNKLEIAYSYDITLSKYIRQTLGTHELSIIYHIPCDKKIRNYNTISCPSF